MRVLDDDDLVEFLRSRVKSEGGQSAFARQHGVDRTYLNGVLNGKKPPGGPSILKALRLCITYTPVERRARADARFLDDDDVLKLLRSRVKSAGSQIAFSKKGVERAHLNRVLQGKRGFGSSILGTLNLRIVYTLVEERP